MEDLNTEQHQPIPPSSPEFFPPPAQKSFTKWIILGVFSVCILVGLTFWAVWRTLETEFPNVSVLKTQFAHVVYNGPKKPFKVELKPFPPSSWTPFEQISPIAVSAIIISEDGNFFSHNGYDAFELKEAIKEDLTEGHFARGASTITMQVVKNVFLTQKKSIYRKVKELILSIRLDQAVSKKRILETYLNLAEWGEGIFGIGPASRFYFNKHPSQLTAKEGAFLAMLLPSPKKYSQSFRSKQLTDYAQKTIRSLLKKLTVTHHLTDAQLETELNTPLSFEVASGNPTPQEPEDADEEPEESEVESVAEPVSTPPESPQ